MASGSSGRANSMGKGFDFSSDDILSSYEGYGSPDISSNNHSEPSIGGISAKEFQKNRMSRSSLFPTPTCSPHEDPVNHDIMLTVEKTMKKYADNLLHFLEGISSRLSQLELNCYNLDKSIADMRSEANNHREELELKLKSVEKHVQEVHRSVQILRDKQELAETQKELAKLQLIHKESSSNQSQNIEVQAAASSLSKTEGTSDMKTPQAPQLALVGPNQVAPQSHHHQVAPPSQPPTQHLNPPQPYYIPSTHLPIQPVQAAQHPQGQYLHSDNQYQPQQVIQLPQVPPPYPRQWPRPQTTPIYPPYPSQPMNQPLPESLPHSMQVSGVPPQSGRTDSSLYGYEAPARVQELLPPVPRSSLPRMSYEQDGGVSHYRQSQPPFYPKNPGPQPFPQSSHVSELVEKLVSMGYRGDHVMGVIQKLEETGQGVDFNAVLDCLNGHSSGGGSQRVW